MSNAKSSWSKWSIVSLALLALAAFSAPSSAQGGPTVTIGYSQLNGVADDWTQHHVVFSNPGTEEQAIKAGRYDEWLKIVNDPRYVMHQMKRGLPAQGPASGDVDAFEAIRVANRNIDPVGGGVLPHRWDPIKPKRFRPKSPINTDWNESVGTATSSTAIAYPAKWSFATGSESCTGDFVIYPTGQAGATAQATILAYYNLYSECGGTVPEVDWQYNTGTGSTVSLAPAFSADGSQVAFIQSNGTSASLVLLRYKLITTGSGTLSTLTSQSSAANYYNSGTGCTAPCVYTIALSGTPNDTWSNPYYDYGTDTLFVGDSAGKLHKFTPVFKGAPAEVTTTWPIQMVRGATTDSNQLASPVYDSNSGNVFVGSTTSVSATTGGYFYAVKASTGAILGYSSTQLDTMYGIRDASLLDPVAEKAYVFAGYNSSTASAVYQFSATGFSGLTAPAATATLVTGANSDQAYIFAGTFDNTYYTSPSGTSPTGYLYVCPTGDTTDALYQISISAGTMSATATEGPVVGDTGTYYPRCSPITEFYNSNATTAATAATGTVTIATNPRGWTTTYPTVMIGATTYTFVTGAPTANNQVEIYSPSSFNAATNEDDTADDLEAVIMANSSYCAVAGCVHTGQTANASVTATVTGNVVDLTAKTTGTSSDFTLSANNGSDTGALTVSGGNNGTNASNGIDYLFVSVFASSRTGCTEATTNGCVMSFNITNPASWSTSTAPLGTLNISSPALNTLPVPNPAAPTSGIIVDNNGTAAGQSEIYFLTQDNSASTACVTGGADGICAIQASQAVP